MALFYIYWENIDKRYLPFLIYSAVEFLIREKTNQLSEFMVFF